MRRMVLLAACVSFAALVAPVAADDKQDCASSDPDRKIQACTVLIDSGRDSRPSLATAYHNRGAAHANKKDYDQAIADYTKAIEIDPSYAAAYNDRGVAYTSKGDYQRAVADVTRAVELGPKLAPRPTAAAAKPVAARSAKKSPSSTAQSTSKPVPVPQQPKTTVTTKQAIGEIDYWQPSWAGKFWEIQSN